ncbi:hypothetical protein D3C77_588710 [compost metagenome]
MLALHGHVDQTLFTQALKMAAGRGCADISGGGQLGSGARAPVQQQAQHARAGGVGNGARHGREIDVGELGFHDSL